MRRAHSQLALVMMASGVFGCAAEVEPSEVAVARAALSACDEVVPANRFIDGIPAYAQCEAAQNSAIYSNNGIDTSTTQVGPDWVRTQYSGGYQCTEFAHRYLHFHWDVRWLPRGNAGEWCDTQPPADSGMVQTTEPVHGDLIVLAPGSCGAAQGTGHVAVVDTVDAATGRISAVQQNRASRGTYELSCGLCFLHVVENDGEPVGSAGGGAPAPGGAGAAGSMAAAGAEAPPPEMMPEPPAMMPPPTTPPPVTPPEMMVPPATPPTTGQAGAAAPPPAAGDPNASPAPLPGVIVPARSPRSSEDTGCSVTRGVGTSAQGGASVWLALCIFAFSRARRFRRARLSDASGSNDARA